MHPNSSTSSSEAGRYLLLAVAALVLVMGLVSWVSFMGIQRGLVTWKEARLLHYQLEKLAAGPRIDVLMVGDSTLGNTVDTAAWSRKLGRAVVALPLTGNYGYEGTLNMIRRVLRRQRPELIVVIQSVDMMTRKVAYDGLLYTAESPADLQGVPPWRLVGKLANLDIPFSMIQNLGGAEDADQAAVDAQLKRLGYIEQHDAAASREHVVQDAHFFEPDMIKPEKVAILDRIGDLCRRQGIPCLYAHGPYVEPECGRIGPYLGAVDAAVGRAGLTLVQGTPVCMTLDEAGDSADHVAPALKPAFSDRYLQLVEAAWPPLRAVPAAPASLVRADRH